MGKMRIKPGFVYVDPKTGAKDPNFSKILDERDPGVVSQKDKFEPAEEKTAPKK